MTQYVIGPFLKDDSTSHLVVVLHCDKHTKVQLENKLAMLSTANAIKLLDQTAFIFIMATMVQQIKHVFIESQHTVLLHLYKLY